jgi:mgtE-like transporter
VITPRGRPETPAIVDGMVVSVQGLAVFALIGAVAYGLGILTGLPGMPSFGTLLEGTLVSGVVATAITIAASYYLAIVTFRFGLDPDNQSVPTITSVMDLSGVAVVLFVMTSIGVLPHA